MSKAYFVIFILIALLVYFFMHYLIYSRIVYGFNLSSRSRVFFIVFLSLGALFFPMRQIIGRSVSLPVLSHIGYIWLGLIAIAFTIFLLCYVCYLAFPDYKKLITILALSVTAVISGYSYYHASLPPKLREIQIRTPKLPANLPHFTIVQLSDLHLEELVSVEWLEGVVAKTNQLQPDLIVITGDLIDEDFHKTRRFTETLSRLKAKYGVVAVTGNHEFFSGVIDFERLAQATGIKILRNTHLTIADSIEIVGIDDDTGKRFSGKGADLEAALQGVDLKKPVILLSHSPSQFEKAAQLGVSLQLSGHTHAGQMPPIEFIVPFVFKYHFGLYYYRDSAIYTTAGTGRWGPPMRFLTRSEIVKVVLFR